ncbi:conserved hypothetical protein [Pyrenophora tritici-repentis Pt-1C-BFP]|uniref:GH16 domain-containing protein n=1 Tax=Pyrenophora tritici-repentis (strain Pt-1C-BFP) TaxID=426418 RepID=B2WFN6_PYRTR|nr:uncharacterized protein PTRG_08742 [Pyrenophora tritici-repentis Pt-1C-BFP]EDU41793.1 conserved hypothetical protein [Pyrenophora tritici-repentis Pt-1C-BFP]
MRSIPLLGLVLVHVLPALADVSRGQESCTCGFYDGQTKELFTDSIIVYFNETTDIPADFVAEEFQQRYGKDWNAVYREGASPANVRINQSVALDLVVQPSTADHIVTGASLRTARRDIQHGSFRTLIKSPSRRALGTAASMMWKYNETQMTELSVMNTNYHANPWVGTFVNNEFTTRNLGMNFSQLLNDTAANRNYTTLGGGMANGSINPWEFTEYRIDWTVDYINFYIGGNLTRQVLQKKNKKMPSVPSALYFKHWSTGNRYSMRGPPTEYASVAEVGWIRMFFNSSSMTDDSRQDFAVRCPLTAACSMDDISLRGSTPFTEIATKKWKQNADRDIKRMPALWLSVTCIIFSTVLIIHALVKRLVPKFNSDLPKETPAPVTMPGEDEKNSFGASAYTVASNDIFADRPSGDIRSSDDKTSSNSQKRNSIDDLAIERIEAVPAPSTLGDSTPKDPLCSLVVTVMHFGLTFVPAIVTPSADAHNASEPWAQRIVGPFLLNQMWLGVFFTTSVRFLTAPYLRKGRMDEICKATVRRTPRLMIPVASMALLEYFFIDIGATRFLQYIPSLTWSTWPYVTRYNNFAQYISEILELMFLVPNAVPQITLHYCTGVLWTIAVQLQGSWLVLLGAVVVYEIKTPWKRMAYYSFCLINHWYAQSWGTYLWIGLILTDLDVTFKWKAFLNSKPAAYYPVITFFWTCVGLGFLANVLPTWGATTFNFSTGERGIHPDASSGEAIMNTDLAGYPPYYTPRLNGLLFAGGMQAVVELSSAVQWFLSTPPFLILFPHVFTIYLIHGLVFWSYGSWLLIVLAERGIPYGINIAVVGVTSYAVMFASLPIVTPVIEALGKDMTALVWMTATNKSPPRRPTLYPFEGDLFTGRAANAKSDADGLPNTDVENGLGVRSSMNNSDDGNNRDSKGKATANVSEHEMHAYSTDENTKDDRNRVSRFSIYTE